MKVNAHTNRALGVITDTLSEQGVTFWNYKDGVLAVKTSEEITADIAGLKTKSSNPHNGGFITKFKI